MGKPGKEIMIDFYRQMLRIRRAEEKLMEVFSAGEIMGFLHVSIGQEAAPVGVCAHLRDDDYIGTTHRGHGYAIAKGIDLKRAMAELFGRKEGYCMGRSGSMHLADLSKGIMGANGIVGGGIPIVAGAGFAAKYKGTDQVAVATFGDGATNQGTFHETLNIASVMNLPVIFREKRRRRDLRGLRRSHRESAKGRRSHAHRGQMRPLVRPLRRRRPEVPGQGEGRRGHGQGLHP
jgi:TPP-dependent pyruvate/acetoin dehydrogenase alpha subunit